MKSKREDYPEGLGGSLPTLGAWIEILPQLEIGNYILRRSLHWERGLKYLLINFIIIPTMSLPTLGAWIEMWLSHLLESALVSLPTLGAWIEIFVKLLNSLLLCVAPYIGSVD